MNRLCLVLMLSALLRAADTPHRIPDLPVIDQNGRRLAFYTDLVKGKTVAINFVFTTCKTICPSLTATFRKVQQELGDRVGRDIQLISVTVDPATDRPERLKPFAETFHAGPGWTFVTGAKADIDVLLVALGASAVNREEHTPNILIGNDRAGYWTRTYGLASAAAIAKSVEDAAARQSSASADAAAAYFPNQPVVTHDGRTVRFFDDLVKNKTVLINFMFTTCTGICSPMTANLARVQKYLGDHLGKDIHMISITVDPAHDTPEVLAKYARTFKAQPGWSFVTGTKQNVDWILYKLGGYVENPDAHSGVLILGNAASGEWHKLQALGDPAQLGAAALKVAAP